MAQHHGLREVVLKLFEINAISFGEFKLKSGLLSPIYFNLRVIIGYPELLRKISELLWKAADNAGASYQITCGVPYTALPLATCISLDHNIPMVIRRREAKDYGTKQMIEGVYAKGDTCLIVEDVVTSGGSVYETAVELNKVQVIVKDAVVLLDRGQGGKERLMVDNIKLHSVLEIAYVLDVLVESKKITRRTFDAVHKFINDNQFKPSVTKDNALSRKETYLTYEQRAEVTINPIAKRIFNIMHSKQTNLVFSVDSSTTTEVLRLANLVGPHICVLKTHVDIITDFTMEFVKSLVELSKKHNFVIFEDRKFADIGSTVVKQYSEGVYHIKDWAELTNAHSVPGNGVIKGLREAAQGLPRAALLIAQMSCKGSLTNESYVKSSLEIAVEFNDFVIGFICTSKLTDDPKFIHMTPGVNLSISGDSLGQQYLSPEEVIKNRKCDAIIVGRGIYSAEKPEEVAVQYKEAAFKAYLERMST